MDTFEKIRALLAEQLDVDPAKITLESDIMSDFEADSLDIVDMVMTLEDEFGIEVPDDAIESLRTVGDVVNFVDSHAQNTDFGKKPRPLTARHPAAAADGALFWFVRNARRLAHGLRRKKQKWQKTTRSSCRRSPARKKTLHSGTPTSA